MKDILQKFVDESLFDASSALLDRLNIRFDRETAESIDVKELYDGNIPTYLLDALAHIDKTYYIGVVNDNTLRGEKSEESVVQRVEEINSAGKYEGLFVFACDVKSGHKLTRSSASALTRAFNRIACATPVVLIIRQGALLSLSTCERTEYTQEWRKSQGEKLGRVSFLRNIDCTSPHRGHLDILSSLGDRLYPSFDALYKHWMEVFSSELLTKQFYSELSDWYAWALNVVRFPNRMASLDDRSYNSENTIRLITRLVFVWFLKQKNLVPGELFNQDYIAHYFIKGFNPNIEYDAITGYRNSDSTYYKAILQNLFFAMLNNPSSKDGHRRTFGQGGLLYKNMLLNPSLFLEIANTRIPFLNSGLFECLDFPDREVFFDGFSEEDRIQSRLCVPDYLFFGNVAGGSVDLSGWYDDDRKSDTSVRGIIQILESYHFTVEENTPFDQEVSLDPELLGKIFENLLAAYNPETRKTARKQTGSFYTPVEIVHYLTESSLYEGICNKCNSINRELLKEVVSYNEAPLDIDSDTKEKLVRAIYSLKVIDPACGSGAFPLSVLQQMVHMLSRLDPNNEIWKKVILEEALSDSRNALLNSDRKSRQQKLIEIEEEFNYSMTDADYMRKLYIIRNCLYGVDIQPIAIQITQLRFFISLIVEQKCDCNPDKNFGIRPLPNIETKFVSADSLMRLEGELTVSAENACSDLRMRYVDSLNNLYASQDPSDKRIRRSIANQARIDYVNELRECGLISSNAYQNVLRWDAFNANQAAGFYNSQIMFGVSCFDIVIGNPPFGATLTAEQQRAYREQYQSTVSESTMYFIEHGFELIPSSGILSYIVPKSLTYASNYRNMRAWLLPHLLTLSDCGKAFEKVKLEQCIIINKKLSRQATYDNYVLKNGVFVYKTLVEKSIATDFGLLLNDVFGTEIQIATRIRNNTQLYLDDVSSNTRGEGGLQSHLSATGRHRVVGGKEIDRVGIRSTKGYISRTLSGKGTIKTNSLLFQNVVAHIMNPFPHVKLIGCIPDDSSCYITDTINQIEVFSSYDARLVWAILNSDLISWYVYSFIYGKAIRTMHFDAVATDRIPIIFPENEGLVVQLVEELIAPDTSADRAAELEKTLNLLVYKTYGVRYEEIGLIDPCISLTEHEYYSL